MIWLYQRGLSCLCRFRCASSKPDRGRVRRAAIALAFSVAGLTALPARAQARGNALPTATRAGDLQLGGGVVFGSSTYNFQSTNLVGGAFYTTFDVRAHLGGEANFRQNQSSADSTVY